MKDQQLQGMELAIRKAVEGGWSDYTTPYDSTSYPKEKVLLDPLFWQCLGKEERWAMTIFETDTMGSPIGKIYWLRYWHRFIDHIADGKGIDSFFTTLLSVTK